MKTQKTVSIAQVEERARQLGIELSDDKGIEVALLFATVMNQKNTPRKQFKLYRFLVSICRDWYNVTQNVKVLDKALELAKAMLECLTPESQLEINRTKKVIVELERERNSFGTTPATMAA